MTPVVGFVGIGNMGAPMARRLAEAGHRLTLYDLDRSAAGTLASAFDGVSVSDSLAALGAASDPVITMLPDSLAVRRAILGDGDGVAAGLRPGALAIDMSSSAPTDTLALGEDLAERGIDLVDAPVSGGVPRARDGSLTIMTGGAPGAVARATPLLETMGSVRATGALGTGHAMKALNNYVSAAGLLATCEALIVAGRFGLDPRVANEILKSSTGRNNTTDLKVERYMLSRAFDSGFALDLMRKDVGVARTLAGKLGLDAPWLAACEALLIEAADSLGPGADHTEAFAFLEQRLGEPD